MHRFRVPVTVLRDLPVDRQRRLSRLREAILPVSQSRGHDRGLQPFQSGRALELRRRDRQFDRCKKQVLRPARCTKRLRSTCARAWILNRLAGQESCDWQTELASQFRCQEFGAVGTISRRDQFTPSPWTIGHFASAPRPFSGHTLRTTQFALQESRPMCSRNRRQETARPVT